MCTLTSDHLVSAEASSGELLPSPLLREAEKVLCRSRSVSVCHAVTMCVCVFPPH